MITTLKELYAVRQTIERSPEKFYVERYIGDRMADAIFLWEITEKKEIRINCITEMFAQNCSYDGAFYPSEFPESVLKRMESELMEKLGPYLIRHGGKGYYVCDMVIDAGGVPLWTDFNPRKGGTLYIWDMVRRISKLRLNGADCAFCYKHLHGDPDNSWRTFGRAAEKLSGFLDPEKDPFIVITNPAITKYGDIDLTGISAANSREDAEAVVNEAKARLSCNRGN